MGRRRDGGAGPADRQRRDVAINTKRVPVRTLPELIAFAATRSQELDYGTAGVGSVSHLTGETLKEHTGLRMKHIPYRGAGPAANDLLGAQIDIAIVTGLGVAGPPLGNTEVRAIAVTGLERAPQAPDVPTVAETHPGFSMTGWLGLAGPAGLPPDVTERLAGWMWAALADPTVVKRLIGAGVSPGFHDGADVARVVREELGTYSTIIKRLGIKPE